MEAESLVSYWSLFLKFWSFSEPNVVWVLLGATLLGASGGMIGCFAFLRKRSLTGDALAHAALPGVTTAFLLFESRHPMVILSGAVISCFIGYLIIEFLVLQTRIKEDSAFAIVLSVFFAAGVFQLGRIQKMNMASQAGLDRLLFGQAASMVRSDVAVLGVMAGLLILFVAVFFQRLKMFSFDRNFALSQGLSAPLYEGMLALAIVLSTVIGLQLVGVVLMAAILLTPAASARYWTERLSTMVVLAGVFGGMCGAIGANISYIAPRMPTGPWMVVAISLIFVLSVLFAPERGVLAREARRRKLVERTRKENILRTMYKIGEALGSERVWMEAVTIQAHRSIPIRDLESDLSALVRRNLVERRNLEFRLTEGGLQRATELTKFHRLWELYLSERIGISSDHVHADAEEIEHMLTPELGERLSEELHNPVQDPHGRSIPTKREPNE